MSKRLATPECLLRRLVWFSLLLSFIACLRPAEPTKTPTRTPLPTPDELAIYVMLSEQYTAPYVIVQIYDMSTDQAARILRALQAIEPPPRVEELHQQAVDAYQQICAGKLLLPGADSELRSEAYFMVDWGINRLLDYNQQLERLRQ